MLIQSIGHASRCSYRNDKYGFSNRLLSQKKIHFSCQTGDIIKTVVTSEKQVSKYVGKVAIGRSGSCNISAKNRLLRGISRRLIQRIHAKDSYSHAV